MLRVVSINFNGVRSAIQKGFFTWMLQQNVDIVCAQELKTQDPDIVTRILQPEGYHCYFHFAEKKGYSGVGIFTRHQPNQVITGLGWPEADQEGRYVEADFGDLAVASLYMPSGTSGEHRQLIKFDFLDRYAKYLKALRNQSRHYIICGDWNIAHKQIDLKNWRANQKNTGFLPEERAWMDTLFGSLGFVDAFRILNQEPEQYTWWSHRGQARAKNVGWRIDYQVISPELKDKVKSVSIYKEQRFSDHAPLVIDYDINLMPQDRYSK